MAVVKQVAQRYLVAAVVFGIAAVWSGLGVSASFECLLAFTAAYVGAAAVQRRRAASAARAGRRTRSRSRAESRRPRRESAHVYDDEAGDEAVWPQLAERW